VRLLRINICNITFGSAFHRYALQHIRGKNIQIDTVLEFVGVEYSKSLLCDAKLFVCLNMCFLEKKKLIVNKAKKLHWLESKIIFPCAFLEYSQYRKVSQIIFHTLTTYVTIYIRISFFLRKIYFTYGQSFFLGVSSPLRCQIKRTS